MKAKLKMYSIWSILKLFFLHQRTIFILSPMISEIIKSPVVDDRGDNIRTKQLNPISLESVIVFQNQYYKTKQEKD